MRPAAAPRPRFAFPMMIISQICFLAALLMVILVKALSLGSRRAPCPSECGRASIAAGLGNHQLVWLDGQLCRGAPGSRCGAALGGFV